MSPMEALQAPAIRYEFECIGPDGKVKWRDGFTNLVTTAGKTDIIDKYLKGSAYTAAWYLLLKAAGTAAVGDTLASHVGWAEATPYVGNRPAISWGTTTAGSNTSVAVSLAINANATIAGAGIASAATGSGGVLYSIGDFSAPRALSTGDTLNVTMTVGVS